MKLLLLLFYALISPAHAQDSQWRIFFFHAEGDVALTLKREAHPFLPWMAIR